MYIDNIEIGVYKTNNSPSLLGRNVGKIGMWHLIMTYAWGFSIKNGEVVLTPIIQLFSPTTSCNQILKYLNEKK